MTESATKYTLNCSPRTSFGKKNRALRKSGIVPAIIYGEGADSTAVSLSAIEFKKVFAQAGETAVIYCVVDGKEIPTLVSDVSINSILDTVNHIDFRRVNLKKEISAQVPVELTGESPAVKSLGGVLLQQIKELEVKALPQNIPQAITIDVSVLAEVGQEITVGSLPKSSVYEVIEEADRVIVSITAHKEESTESQLDREETEITTAKVAEGEEGAEGAAPAADDKAAPKAEAAKPEAKK
ncbi:MAG: 50S ribosomal protein L25 [bacterium]